MKRDECGLQVLDRIECLALMRSVPVGRIVFTERALPAVQPVGFALDDDGGGHCVVIQATPESRLAAATRDSIVAFQTDAFDAADGTGWSVTVIGWARAVHDQTIRISCRRVTGYRHVRQEVTFGEKARTLVPIDPSD
ncbi:pyridoxamine 5'-phosphate oxidase family protein [Actinomadura barringtoniae]|uniref:Pyridoxamine 5'-phosphate oxidase family protein n=1 Tax=Actinomadura barringtoniae TaxID=1427535 RepID=A0A939T7Q5_9ACTN|nr:pyridoxamine 5'-phosphate oxidase family protein [Actinomadura barringtoniae]MBO2446110.1 pyridoxamine 5'-phosphate oxidase family protein [Actinomadura barringtoniae]